jgi:hypothetical protein
MGSALGSTSESNGDAMGGGWSGVHTEAAFGVSCAVAVVMVTAASSMSDD